MEVHTDPSKIIWEKTMCHKKMLQKYRPFKKME